MRFVLIVCWYSAQQLTNESCGIVSSSIVISVVSTLSSSIPMSPSQWKWNDLQSILSTSESIQLVCQQELDDLLRRKAHLSCNSISPHSLPMT